ncbi:uncharacterized protein LAJ45_09526 [Morchella importuna]|uniref:uncharacterized protein n=1 Tax=Morchella importuna TaxID=1174673 RepID=UPI001E8DC708|nr:uncharacterized protein LAJ45_09526 [Morchella importuna]KAH8146333.1 hypothetical protein LAJ45_09526 [Morchella importuna]
MRDCLCPCAFEASKKKQKKNRKWRCKRKSLVLFSTPGYFSTRTPSALLLPRSSSVASDSGIPEQETPPHHQNYEQQQYLPTIAASQQTTTDDAIYAYLMSAHGHYYNSGGGRDSGGGGGGGGSGGGGGGGGGQPSQSPFYSSQGPPQHHGYVPNSAASPVSNYSNSPPQQQPPPIRSHTAAPYSSGGYAPPSNQAPGGGYYGQPPSHPSQASGPPPSSQGPYRTQQGGGGSRPDRHEFSPSGQSQPPPRSDYGPPASAGGYSPDLPAIIANTHNLPPEVVQRLAEDLMRSIQFGQPGGPGGGGGVAPAGAAPLLTQPVAPHGQQRQGSPAVTTIPAPPPQPQGGHGPHQPHYGMPPVPGPFPGYGPGGQETAPAPGPPPPHHGQKMTHSQQYGAPPGQASYFPPQPAPIGASGPPHMSPKGPPAMALRDDNLGRKPSHRQSKSNATSSGYGPTPGTSASSTPSGKPKMSMDDGAIFFELWGDLVDKEPGREPRPKEKLVTLLRETANYMIKERPVKESIVITPEKMVDFYTCNAVEKEPLDWKLFFTGRTLASLSSIYRALNCEHFYMPPASDQKPCIPALTPRGFETWMFTQLMSDPNRESQRLQKLVSNWQVINPKTGHPFPKSIPRRCFPEKEDAIISDGWWRVWEEFPRDYSEDSEDETLALPAPGGGHHYPPREQMTPPEAMEGPFVPAGPPHRGGSKKIPMTMPMSYPPDDDEDDRRHGPPKGKSKTPRKPDPHWRESELNPRPILGEEARAAPPTRPHTSHGHHPSADSPDKPRSSRQRDRSEYRHRRHQSRHQSRHRHEERSPSPDEGDWSASSGISARTPGSGDGPPLDAPAPPPAGGSKRAEEVVREQREAIRRFEAQNARNRQYDDSYPDDFEEYQHPRDRDRERDDRRVAEYAYQDEFERDVRRTSTGGAAAAPAPGSDGGRRSHHGGGRREGPGGFYR